MKKTKLNSTNPKYHKQDIKAIKVRKEFAKEVKKCKIYKTYYLT